jgi:hypothetical protein
MIPGTPPNWAGIKLNRSGDIFCVKGWCDEGDRRAEDDEVNAPGGEGT